MFQVCTLEGWSSLMFNLADAGDHSFISYSYFTVVVIIGSFFTMNLILAQIIDSYTEQQSKITKKVEFEK